MRRLLALGDALAVLVALGICDVLDAWTRFDTSLGSTGLTLMPIFILSWLGIAGLAGTYHSDERRIGASTADDIFRVLQLAGLWIWSVFLVAAVAMDGSLSATPAISLGLVAVPTILGIRGLTRGIARRRSWYAEAAVIVGTAEDCGRVTQILERHPEYGIRVVATVDPRSNMDPDFAFDPVSRRLLYLIESVGADRVVFASTYRQIDERSGVLRRIAELGIKVDLVPGDKEVFRSDAEIHHIEGLPLLTLPNTRRPRSALFVKRIVDITISGLTLTVMSPVLLACAVAIKLDSRGPVLFRQERIGRQGTRFKVLKFRTMVPDADAIKHTVDELNTRTDGMFKIKDDPRITRVGGWLRKYSLDELPQLFNVLRGEMSLVGPRPLIEIESEQVNKRYAARFDVRPGITGMWQVLGRSDIPFEDMVKLDYTYVINWSISHDAKLMVRTLSAMGSAKGAY